MKRFPLRAWTAAGLCVVASCATATGCLRRDVSALSPTTKVSLTTNVPQPAIDKVDVLVMVDNSSSMADKQKILADAVPDLVRALVQPKCVDKTTKEPLAGGDLADPLKPDGAQCPAGSEPAFTPITDMHVGVISSSLGAMGLGECMPTAGQHNDDGAHLLARGPDGTDVAAAGDFHFLAWYPDVAANTDKTRHPDPPVPKTASLDALGKSFHDLVVGVGQDGCGLEAQLESVYRFLAMPDPWTQIQVDNHLGNYGPPSAIDWDLLKQRAAFLRPDSLVAVIVLTDEDDSWVDPLSFGGAGVSFMSPTPLPRATAICASDPISPACISCGVAPPGDPSCAIDQGFYTSAEDPMNVRFYRMKQRFGVDPQYPVTRYADALSKPKVPRRATEHDAHGWNPTPDCTNPLFAAHLPTAETDEVCHLARGPRSPGLVYFAIIGGISNTLLPDANDPAAKIDWTKILGVDPDRYDESKIDPHMLPSIDPRPGLPGPDAADDADPIVGREWNTGGVDLEYACTFDLYERADDGTITPTRRACTGDETACDCDGKKDSPLCAPPPNTNVQIKGKAYPTRRELMVAKALDAQAVVASLCPKQLTNPAGDDYGYRPAVRAITDRLTSALIGTCLPQALDRDPDGSVPCTVVAVMADPGPDSDCQARYGLTPPPPAVLEEVRAGLVADEGTEAAGFPICNVPQIPEPAGSTCKTESTRVGFCYGAGEPGLRTCSYDLVFTKATARLGDARFVLQCIQVSSEDAGSAN